MCRSAGDMVFTGKGYSAPEPFSCPLHKICLTKAGVHGGSVYSFNVTSGL